jgi:hypothetical protein
MVTYQDLLTAISQNTVKDFVKSTINNHKGSAEYQTALCADEYNRRLNRTITEYQKLLYKVTGEAVPDNYTANFKLRSNFFNRLITQLNQYLLGNGVTWGKEDTEKKLGKSFDNELEDAGEKALVHSVSFGFWNLDHMEVFSLLEFAPLYDEEDGALKAGIRFWQIDPKKPLRATLYELDGYTDYMWNEDNPDGEIVNDKRPYILKTKSTQVDGTVIYDYENYPTFPIVPFWGNKYKQSEFVGMRENIDCYDLIKSGFANTVDDASMIYWTIQNAGGMDDIDLAKFVEHMKTIKASVVEQDGASAEAHTLDVPYASRETLLNRIRADIYEDFMALDTKNIANGAVTATQIEASYEPLNGKADKYEYCVIKFIDGILALAGIDDSPTFTRSKIINRTEEIQTLVQAGEYLTEDYVAEKVLTILGDGDRVEELLGDRDIADMQRMGNIGNENRPDNAMDGQQA